MTWLGTKIFLKVLASGVQTSLQPLLTPHLTDLGSGLIPDVWGAFNWWNADGAKYSLARWPDIWKSDLLSHLSFNFTETTSICFSLPLTRSFFIYLFSCVSIFHINQSIITFRFWQKSDQTDQHTQELHIDIYWSKNRTIGLMCRVFANGPGDRDSILGRVIPKTQKMVLDAVLLNTQHYKVRIKGKVEQSREWSSALPYTSV